MAYAAIDQRLKSGDLVILDGATGTELQRRGVAMEPTAWCGAMAAETIPILEQIHRDYIAAGAQVIIANTFATSRIVLRAAGLADRFAEINARAVEAALTAAQGADVAVAGSLSHMIPRRDLHGEPDPTEIEDSYQELAEFLAEAGCDLIALEMMFAPERMDTAFRAATNTGLPVWAGLSARRGADGAVLSFAQDRDIPFAEVASLLDRYLVEAAGVMHSESEVTGDALALIRDRFDGPLTAYPDSGHMKLPEWQFEEIIPVDDYLAYARTWRGEGAQVIGGCCGLSVDHIAALKNL